MKKILQFINDFCPEHLWTLAMDVIVCCLVGVFAVWRVEVGSSLISWVKKMVGWSVAGGAGSLVR